MLKSGVIVFIGLAITKLLNLLCHVVITNNSQPEVYGVFSIAFTVVMYCSTVVCLGLNQSIVKFASSENISTELDVGRRDFAFFCFKVSITISFVLSLFLYLLSPDISLLFFNEPDLVSTLQYASISLPFMAILMMSIYLFRSQRIFWPEVVFRNFLRSFIFLAILLYLITVGEIDDPLNIAFAFLVSFVVASLISIFALYIVFEKTETAGIKWSGSMALRYGILTVISVFFYEGIVTVDKIILGYFEDSVLVGKYSAAAMIARQTETAGIVLFTILGPKIAAALNANRSIHSSVLRTSLASMTLSLICLLVLYFLKTEILRIFGSEYVVMSDEFILLSSGFLFSMIAVPMGTALQFGEHIKLDIAIMSIGFAANIGGSIFAVSAYGSMGAALSTTATLFLISLLRIIIYRRLYAEQNGS